MAQAPGYDEIRAKRAEQQIVRDAAQNMQMTDQNMTDVAQANKNPVLQRYMQKQQGLGDIGINPGPYVMQAASIGQGKNVQEYSASMLDAAINGQANPEAVLSDPAVLDQDKSVLLSLLQGGPTNEVAPAGLGQLPVR